MTVAKELSAKQIKGIVLLVTGMRSKDVATELGLSPQTISEWKSNPYFEAELNKLKLEGLHTARDMIRASANPAIESLVEIAKHAENEETRRKACIDILTLTGFTDPRSGQFGWGVGKTSPEEIVEQKLMDKAMANLFSSTKPKYNPAAAKEPVQ